MHGIIKTTAATMLFFTAIASKSFAQINFSGYEIGINAGTLIYQGDLTPGFLGSLNFIKPAVGVYVAKSINAYFSVRASFSHGNLSADESIYATPEWRRQRNFKFSSAVNELSSTLVFNPYGESERRLSPYIFAGAGIAFLNTSRNWDRFNSTYFDVKSVAAVSLAADTLRALPKAIAVLPVGVGLKYRITPRLALNAESTWRVTSSDYLDGFSYQGEIKNRDAYYGLSLGMSFRFGKDRYACPAVAR